MRESSRRWLIKRLVYLAALAVTALATIVLVYAVQARINLPDLHAWHRIVLREEAGARNPAAFESFEAYRRQEDKLFAELRERIYTASEADTFSLGRPARPDELRSAAPIARSGIVCQRRAGCPNSRAAGQTQSCLHRLGSHRRRPRRAGARVWGAVRRSSRHSRHAL
jgi:hypothetical protein